MTFTIKWLVDVQVDFRMRISKFSGIRAASLAFYVQYNRDFRAVSKCTNEQNSLSDLTNLSFNVSLHNHYVSPIGKWRIRVDVKKCWSMFSSSTL